MDNTTRLEDVRDYVRRKGYENPGLCLLLERFWPSSDGKDMSNMSAMDCLLVVVRHIYCNVVPRDTMDGFLAANELLTFALSNFGSDTPEELKKEREAREHMYETIVKGWKLGDNPSFADLSESEAMLNTIWAHEDFRLYYPILHRRLGASHWSLLPDEQQAVLEARESLVVWDTERHDKIQGALEEKFGWFEGCLKDFGKDKVQFTKYNSSPVVMRVEVLTRKKLDNFNMNTIQTIMVPVHKPDVKNRVGGTQAGRTVKFSKNGTAMYILLAVVKLRVSETERDRVRLYDHEGRDIVPITPKVEVEGFVDDTWLLEHQDSSYILYYFRNSKDCELSEPKDLSGGPPQVETGLSSVKALTSQKTTEETDSGEDSRQEEMGNRMSVWAEQICQRGHSDSYTDYSVQGHEGSQSSKQ
ncbi:hypothetical protein VMCG_09612 [Cytospora schulzeri]|uniref:USP domain-containing protein n=1 Tax=Cytospora schulzeri TaxID=448051 RepID=A0A423VJ84_9PEZI|nr:hypothetical protein VMCG_09612 [Valsa malicola]